MESLNQKEKIIWSCWEEKSPREVVREAAAKGTHITLAIKFLMENNGWNELTANDWFNAEVSFSGNAYHVTFSNLDRALVTGYIVRG